MKPLTIKQAVAMKKRLTMLQIREQTDRFRQRDIRFVTAHPVFGPYVLALVEYTRTQPAFQN